AHDRVAVADVDAQQHGQAPSWRRSGPMSRTGAANVPTARSASRGRPGRGATGRAGTPDLAGEEVTAYQRRAGRWLRRVGTETRDGVAPVDENHVRTVGAGLGI